MNAFATPRLVLRATASALLLALAACHSDIPKSCSKDPTGFECREYHRNKAMADRAKSQALKASQPPKPYQPPKPNQPKPSTTGL